MSATSKACERVTTKLISAKSGEEFISEKQ